VPVRVYIAYLKLCLGRKSLVITHAHEYAREKRLVCARTYMKEEMANEATYWKSVAIQQLMQSPVLLSSSSFQSSLKRKQQLARRRLALHKRLQSKKKAVLLVMLSTIIMAYSVPRPRTVWTRIR